jgi:transposase
MDYDLRWIRKELEEFGERGPGFRYPEAFRKRVARYADRRLGKASASALAREIGIPWVTIRRWCLQQDTARKKEGTSTPTSMIPVRVTETKPIAETPSEGGVSVVTPDGWRVEGLSVDEACQVLRRRS